MNLGGNCPNHHYQDSCFEQPTTNNLEGWEKFKQDNVFTDEENGRTYFKFNEIDRMGNRFVNTKDVEQFISKLRKHDMEELIKILEEIKFNRIINPEDDIYFERNGLRIGWVAGCNVNQTVDNGIKLIKNYYSK
jgi:hypothetical protein